MYCALSGTDGYDRDASNRPTQLLATVWDFGMHYRVL